MKKFVCIALLLTSNICLANYYTQKGEVQDFIHYMYTTHQFDSNYLLKLFEQVSPDKNVLAKIARPYEEQIWGVYKTNFLNKERIALGVEFYTQYQAVLKKAEQDFGIPANIIIAILGVETYYGQNSGSFPVFATLATLAFEYPKRAAFFKQELEQFLLLTQEQQIDPLQPKGSYAGAMGNAQFIASSCRNFAINYSNSGTINLNNMEDAIGSVANYFKRHGWQPGQPIAHQAKLAGNSYQNLVLMIKNSKNPKPIYKLSNLIQQGISATDKTINEQNINVTVLELDNGRNKKEYWLTRDNFYVITRYNHSNNYAMAVFQLASAIDTALLHKNKHKHKRK